jgi:hypothetical protein
MVEKYWSPEEKFILNEEPPKSFDKTNCFNLEFTPIVKGTLTGTIYKEKEAEFFDTFSESTLGGITCAKTDTKITLNHNTGEVEFEFEVDKIIVNYEFA